MNPLTRSFALTGLALAVAGRAAAQPATWTIDPNHTAAQFAVRHLLVSTVRGQFEKVSGTITWDGKDVRTISANITIDPSSVNTRVAMRDNDLRSDNFFDVARYPTICFVSSKAEPGEPGHFRLTGDLTMHGVTKQITLDVEGPMAPIAQGPMQRTGASATVKLNRRDFGLLYGRLVEGTAVVGDAVTITLDIEAVRKAP